MRVGHTYTRDFDLETRQHEILGFDLGEGPTRRAVIVGLVGLAVWAGGLVVLFGTPGRYTFSAYVVPPLLVTVYGTQRADTNSRRWKLTQWTLAVRYVVVGHRPVINGGRRTAARCEWLPLRERLRHRSDPGPATAGGERPSQEATAGPVVMLKSRFRAYGPDRVFKARGRKV